MKNIIYMLYKFFPRKVKIIMEKIIKRSHKGQGEYWSYLLRKIYKDFYGIQIGIGTYGCFRQEKYKYVTFGNYTSIADGFEFFPRDHPKDYSSLHPLFYNKKFGLLNEDKVKFEKLKIGNDVWIGKNVMVTSKCNCIGNGAIVGCGSVVTKNVEPYTIVAGNPAKIIGKRFDDDTIKLLEDSSWYNLSRDELIIFADYIENPNLFSKAVIQYRNKR